MPTQTLWRRSAVAHCALFLVATLALVFAAGSASLERGFIYPLDDSYIHLALARTLSESGVWGVSAGEPAAASSSPLWSVLLAAVSSIVPRRDQLFSWAPVVINLLTGVGLIVFWARTLAPGPYGQLWLAILWVFVAVGPLSAIGMEHTLHVALAVALGWFGAGTVAQSTDPGGRALLGLGVLAGLAVAARYESLFLVASLAGLAVVYRRYAAALALSLGSAVPVLGFGAAWVSSGGWILPNSLMLKGAGTASPDLLTKFHGLLLNVLSNLLQSLSALAVVGSAALLVAVLLSFRLGRARTSVLAVAAIGTTLLHLALASLGWLFRYEAWLLALNGTALALILAEHAVGRSQIGPAAVLALLFAPRALLATVQALQAPADRLWEHFHPTAFVNDRYAGSTVLVNDLGVPAYYANARVIDIFGLGHNEPIRLRQQPGGYTPEALAGFSAEVGGRIAILQLCWREVNERLPPQWALVGLWRGPRNVVFGDVLVGFFAVDPAERPKLSAALRSYTLLEGMDLLSEVHPGTLEYNNTADKRAAATQLCRRHQHRDSS